MLLMVEKKYLKWNMSHCLSICETNSKYMQIYDENKELPCLKYWDVNIFQMGNVSEVAFEDVPSGFKQVRKTS